MGYAPVGRCILLLLARDGLVGEGVRKPSKDKCPAVRTLYLLGSGRLAGQHHPFLTMDTKAIESEGDVPNAVAVQESPLLEALFELRFQAAVSTQGIAPRPFVCPTGEEYRRSRRCRWRTVPREMRIKDPISSIKLLMS